MHGVPTPPKGGTETAPLSSLQSELGADGLLDRVMTREVVCWLAAGLRPLMGKSQWNCRLKRISPTVNLVAYGDAAGDEDLAIEGVHTCKSALCPLCVRKWQRTRALEIRQAIDNWGAERTLFWTGTVRHHQGMSLGLLVRVMRRAWGDMWGGRAGAEFAEQLGGRPESVRAFEYNWSVKAGWHPHIHALWFFEDLPPQEIEQLQQMAFARWCASLGTAIESLQAFIEKVLAGKPCRWRYQKYMKELDDGTWVERKRRAGIACPQCAAGDECSHYRERAERLFGKKLIDPKKPLDRQLRFVASLFGEITLESIMPIEAYGVDLQRVRTEKMDTYLTKLGAMGFELAGATNKLGRTGKDNVQRYTHWEVGSIVCGGGDVDKATRRRAPKAWKQLFWGTRGTARIAFSDREKLGLKPDPYAAEELIFNPDAPEPPPVEAGKPAGSTYRLVGEVPAGEWEKRVEREGHGWIARIYKAWGKGKLQELDGVKPATGRHSIPSTHDPPEPVQPPKQWWTRIVEESAHQRRTRAAWRSTWGSVRAREARELETQRIREAGLSRLTQWRRRANVRDRLRADNASKVQPYREPEAAE